MGGGLICISFKKLGDPNPNPNPNPNPWEY